MKKYDPTRICKNYARECGTANNCFYCKHRILNTERKVIGCRINRDITDDKVKIDCFNCFKEGSIKCAD